MISRRLDPTSDWISGNLRALSADEIVETISINSLEIVDRGYTIIKNVLNDEEVAALRADIDEIFNVVARDTTIREGSEFRHRILNHSTLCQKMVEHPTIVETLSPVLGKDFHVIANTAWRQFAAIQNDQGWHVDAGPHIPLSDGVEWPEEIPHPVFAVGLHIMLEDCPLPAGPTGVIPKSHLSGKIPLNLTDEEMHFKGNTMVPLIAEKGDFLFFASDVWHRRLSSDGTLGRYFLQVHYGRRDIAQRLLPTSQVNHLSEEALQRAQAARSQTSRTIVGLHRIGYYDS